ncbi:bifunctional riboflavin kinase/FAD synthetase [Sphingomonas sp. BIUV-7]|uniref:Riboflavin biosynthesis protein n=1 Tax=Sphingomonas natans TaxID=3063330 RepID=A0ABT8Y4K1_9SPHN|nr:bifunctional riboflavin kinase/FAD synthetase [Sphingomonas sp. BIUV-7]MDO6413244.1 bifunctional riboflavin kinase/FAD synthetase [Sphingomonas sp. BIUV-7]
MERLTGDAPLPAAFCGGVIALGNFDGFHLGHQAVVGRAVARARAEGRPALAAIFDPHPAAFFRPDLPPSRLTTIDQRARLFAGAGVDAMIVIGFDAALAALSPERFVDERLAAWFGAAGIVTGVDFTFGQARSGTTEMLAALGLRHGFTAEAVAPIQDADGPISSTRIRQALIAGECETATALLTRPHRIEGVVIHGDKRGRTIGYPTANVDLGDYLRPRYGIYAVRARLDDGRVIAGAANLGIRPTFDPPKELLETYLFDFAESFYDRVIEVELVSFLRPEAKFDGLDALVAQMDADCEEARRRLSAVAT